MLQRRRAVVRLEHREAELAQTLGREQAYVVVVLDDQHDLVLAAGRRREKALPVPRRAWPLMRGR